MAITITFWRWRKKYNSNLYYNKRELSDILTAEEFIKEKPCDDILKRSDRTWKVFISSFDYDIANSWRAFKIIKNWVPYKLRIATTEEYGTQLYDMIKERHGAFPKILSLDWKYLLMEWIEESIPFYKIDDVSKYKDLWRIYIQTSKKYTWKLPESWRQERMEIMTEEEWSTIDSWYKTYIDKLKVWDLFNDSLLTSEPYYFKADNIHYTQEGKIMFVDEEVVTDYYKWYGMIDFFMQDGILFLNEEQGREVVDNFLEGMWKEYFEDMSIAYLQAWFLRRMLSFLHQSSIAWLYIHTWLHWEINTIFDNLLEDNFDHNPVVWYFFSKVKKMKEKDV